MVIMEISNIDCASLRGLLEGNEADCLVLDCRSFLSFNSSHISGSTNVHHSNLMRRRAVAGPGVQHIIPNADTRSKLLNGQYQTVVLVDDRSLDFTQVKNNGIVMLAVTALSRNNPCGVDVFFLKGGFETFSSQFPDMCTKAPPKEDRPVRSLPLSPNRPPGSSCNNLNTPPCDKAGPVEILPFLYLGSAYHASRRDLLDMLRITALVNVASNCPNYFEDHYQYKSIPVEDNHKADISSWFNEAIEFIDSVKNKGGRVFVHCQAGISRSATICMAYLIRTNRVRLDEAFEFVKQRRSIVSPNFSFMGQLLQFESQVLSASTCSSEASSPALSNSGSVFTFPVHGGGSPLCFLSIHSPIAPSPTC